MRRCAGGKYVIANQYGRWQQRPDLTYVFYRDLEVCLNQLPTFSLPDNCNLSYRTKLLRGADSPRIKLRGDEYRLNCDERNSEICGARTGKMYNSSNKLYDVRMW